MKTSSSLGYVTDAGTSPISGWVNPSGVSPCQEFQASVIALKPEANTLCPSAVPNKLAMNVLQAEGPPLPTDGDLSGQPPSAADIGAGNALAGTGASTGLLAGSRSNAAIPLL